MMARWFTQWIAWLFKLPKGWQIAVYALGGVAVGSGLVVARIANATSYLHDYPEVCVNCHVMTDAYASWQRGSHGLVAVCTDCHVPHSNVVAKYAYKAADGLKHSYVFTLHKEPQVLELSERARPVVQANCLRCHHDRMAMVRLADSSQQQCWDCHRNIHGDVRSLASSPAALRPRLDDVGLGRAGEGVGQ